jgi:hypothetical protein
LSEEFGGALPSVIVKELERWPLGFLERIVECRAYAATKAAKDHHDNPTQKSELWNLVDAIEFEIAAEDMQADG